MTLTTTFLATALVVPSMPPPEYDDCEVVTNCVFDASRGDAKMFAVQIELDATPSNGVEVVFGRDANGDGRLSRTEAEMAVGYCCGEWKVTNIVTGDTFSCAGTFGCTALDWKLRLNRNRTPRSLAATVNGQPTFTQLATPPPFLFDPTWNAAKIIRRGQSDPNPSRAIRSESVRRQDRGVPSRRRFPDSVGAAPIAGNHSKYKRKHHIKIKTMLSALYLDIQA